MEMGAQGPNGETVTEWLAANAPEWVQAEIENDSEFSLNNGLTPMSRVGNLLVSHGLVEESDRTNPAVVLAVLEVVLAHKVADEEVNQG